MPHLREHTAEDPAGLDRLPRLRRAVLIGILIPPAAITNYADLPLEGRVTRFFRPDGSEVQRVPRWPQLTEVERYEWCARDDLDYDTWATHYDAFDLSEAVGYLMREDGDRDPPPGMAASRAGP